MNLDLNTLAHSHLKSTPLSWGVNVSTVRAASEFSLDCAWVSFHCGCFFLILISPMILGNGWMSGERVKIISINTREWGGGGEQKPLSSPLLNAPTTHICRGPTGTQALLGAEGSTVAHTPRVAALAQRAGRTCLLLLKVPHSFLRKNGH